MERPHWLLDPENVRERGQLLPIGMTQAGNPTLAVPGFLMDAYRGTERFLTGQHAGPVPSQHDPIYDALMAATAIGGPSALRAASVAKPNLGQAGIFGGYKAKAAPRDELAEALMMSNTKDDVGATPSRQDIWEGTGWFKGADDKWRFEIDDSAAMLTPENLAEGPHSFKGTLGQALSHPELFKNYPEMADYPVQIGKAAKGPRGELGSFNPRTNELEIYGGGSSGEEATADLLSTVLHELQHGVQRKEGFDPGASVSGMKETLKTIDDKVNQLNLLQTKVSKQMDEARKAGDTAKLATLQELYDLAMKEKSGLGRAGQLSPETLYLSKSGEVEARQVPKRRLLSAEERAFYAPYGSDPVFGPDTPRAAQILSKNLDISPNALDEIARLLGDVSK